MLDLLSRHAGSIHPMYHVHHACHTCSPLSSSLSPLPLSLSPSLSHSLIHTHIQTHNIHYLNVFVILLCVITTVKSTPFSKVHLALCVENVHLVLVSCKRHLLDFTHDVNMATIDSYIIIMSVCAHMCTCRQIWWYKKANF